MEKNHWQGHKMRRVEWGNRYGKKKKKDICTTEVIAPNAGINVLDHVLHCHQKELSTIGLRKTDFIK